jgi:hypothetical protein
MAAAVLEKPTPSLPREEIDRRVAVLRRFRELLQTQRDRFHEYLNVLDKQKDIIEQGSADDLITHVELEEQIVADIFAIQKVINPLEDMYHALVGADYMGLPDTDAAEVPSLKSALVGLKKEAVIRSSRNKDLLSKRMESLRSDIKTLRSNPYVFRRSVYSDAASPTLIDIKG